MVFNVGKVPYGVPFSGVNPVGINREYQKNIAFENSPDTFQSTLPERYTSEQMISKLAKSNPDIEKILKANNLPTEINYSSIADSLKSHCSTTRDICVGIYDNLPYSLKSEVDLNSLKEASYLHDIGKVFIPEGLLNKKGSFTPEEYKIMQLHSDLGYELLKGTNLSEKTLSLIRNHHQDLTKNGYPKVDKNYVVGTDLQVLALADKYSALTEKRPYKEPMTREQALTLIGTEVKLGKFNPLIYNSLVQATANTVYSGSNDLAVKKLL